LDDVLAPPDDVCPPNELPPVDAAEPPPEPPTEELCESEPHAKSKNPRPKNQRLPMKGDYYGFGRARYHG
jgi:hypothetical protein